MSKVKIYPAEERGKQETGWFCSRNLFNSGQYQLEHRQPFGTLFVLNDDILEAKRSLTMLVEEPSLILLLPVFGAIRCSKSGADEMLAVAGQIIIFRTEGNTSVEISNPFTEEPVNYLQLWFRLSGQEIEEAVYTFADLNKELNQLVPVTGAANADHKVFPVFIGKFSGRGESRFQKTDPQNGIMVFVIEGVFEVEGRLVHPRDGLSLQEETVIEMEALSNDALILVAEIPFI